MNLIRSLNPCFNGRYSQSDSLETRIRVLRRLNPCFNGRYSQRVWTCVQTKMHSVLILVLMEDTLRVKRSR